MGSITIEPGAYPEKHELRTAEALVRLYGDIVFKKPSNQHRIKSADVLMVDLMWEIKAPKTHLRSGLEQVLKRASKQSCNIIIDSFRIRELRDSNVQDFLLAKLKQQKTIKRILLVNKRRQVIDINSLLR